MEYTEEILMQVKSFQDISLKFSLYHKPYFIVFWSHIFVHQIQLWLVMVGFKKSYIK